MSILCGKRGGDSNTGILPALVLAILLIVAAYILWPGAISPIIFGYRSCEDQFLKPGYCEYKTGSFAGACRSGTYESDYSCERYANKIKKDGFNVNKELFICCSAPNIMNKPNLDEYREAVKKELEANPDLYKPVAPDTAAKAGDKDPPKP